MGNIWQGERVRLRAVEPGDADSYYEWGRDTDIARADYFIDFPESREGVKRWAAEQAVAEPKNDEYRWTIETLGGEAVGTIRTHNCDRRAGTFRYGVAVARKHWRKGYARDAIILVLRYFFRELRYQKCTVEIYAFNEASLHLHRELGFRDEGRLRRTVYTDGQYHDDILMGITAEEFEGKKV
jgi:RimJ/RimL family protein N-acetyltransferase